MIVRMKANNELIPLKPENLEWIGPEKKPQDFSERQLYLVWGQIEKQSVKCPADYGTGSLPCLLDSYLTAARSAFSACVKWSVIVATDDSKEGDVLIYPDHRRFHIEVGDEQSLVALITYLCGGQQLKVPISMKSNSCSSADTKITTVLEKRAFSSLVCTSTMSASFMTHATSSSAKEILKRPRASCFPVRDLQNAVVKQSASSCAKQGEPSLHAKITPQRILMKRPAGVVNTRIRPLMQKPTGVVKSSSPPKEASNVPNVFEIDDSPPHTRGRAGVTSLIRSPPMSRSGFGTQLPPANSWMTDQSPEVLTWIRSQVGCF